MRIITVDELLAMLSKYNHMELHVHHTYIPNHSYFNGHNGIELQQNMRNYHVNTKKWDDIGQHVTLLPDGTFVTGRDLGKTPASIIGHNTGAFACEMLGNFDVGHDNLEGKQLESILRLAKYFDDRGKYIRFHRENAPKTCPGSGIDKAQFMAEVKAYGAKKEEPELNIGKCTLVINDHKLDGFIIDGSSYAPIRRLTEELGLEIAWNDATKTVTLKRKDGCCCGKC